MEDVCQQVVLKTASIPFADRCYTYKVLVEIEKVRQKAFLFFVLVIGIIVGVLLVSVRALRRVGLLLLGVGVIAVRLLLLWRRHLLVIERIVFRRLRVRCRALNNFIQLTPVEPYAAALGAIIYFYTLPVGHHQGFVTIGAIHIEGFCVKLNNAGSKKGRQMQKQT